MSISDWIIERLAGLERRIEKLEAAVNRAGDPNSSGSLDAMDNSSNGWITHREFVAPEIHRLLQEEKFDELEQFLAEYRRNLSSEV